MGTSFLLKQSRFFRIVCVCRGGQCVLCLAGYSLPAGSSVSLWTRFLLKPQLTRYLWDTWLLLWRHFESSPLSLTRQVLLLALHLQTGAAFCAFFFVSRCWLSGLAVLTAVCTPSSLHSQKLFFSHFVILGLNIHHLCILCLWLLLSLLEKDHFVGEISNYW